MTAAAVAWAAAAGRIGTSPARHRALLSLFAFLFVAIMLADRHQSSDEGTYLRFARHLAEGHYTHKSTPDLAARRCI
jgi:hypothetical protein